jgi:selenium-binding protein 1
VGAKEGRDHRDPAEDPLPVDIQHPRRRQGLWVNTFMDGKTRYFDLATRGAEADLQRVTGKQVNMISRAGTASACTSLSSLLANWDKGGADNEQFIRGFNVGRQGAQARVRDRLHRPRSSGARTTELGTAKA